ncbi:MAG: protein hupE [Gammaproteobacteria bacterium]|nr:MAG: protein hupE [Gammaproteobacteria bacterium]
MIAARYWVYGSLVLGMSLPAHAHVGAGIDPFLHPFTGMDHLLAALAVGLWGGQQRRLAIPATFLAAMALGMLLGNMGMPLPLVEPGIALSVLALGLFAALALPLTSAGMAAVALFALFHGHAHGTEMALGLGAALALLSGTALLHGAGFVLGHKLRGIMRLGGAAIAASGLLMLPL